MKLAGLLLAIVISVPAPGCGRASPQGPPSQALATALPSAPPAATRLDPDSTDQVKVSAWSAPVHGLEMQIIAPAVITRAPAGWVNFEVTCTIRNTGNTPVELEHLARLFLVDRAGITTACMRREDAMDVEYGGPLVIQPGKSTSLKQDGQVKIDAGLYQLFAVWDGNKDLKSPTVEITVK